MKLIKGVLLLEYADLVDTYGIGRSTIDCGVNKRRKGLSSSWASIKDPEDKRKRLVIYHSIPAQSRKQLPSEQELVKICLKQEEERKKIDQLVKACK